VNTGGYESFVEHITKTIETRLEQNGVISIKMINDEIEKTVSENPSLFVILWMKGLMIRDGGYWFYGMGWEGWQRSYNISVKEDPEMAQDLVFAGIQAVFNDAIERVKADDREIYGERFLVRSG